MRNNCCPVSGSSASAASPIDRPANLISLTRRICVVFVQTLNSTNLAPLHAYEPPPARGNLRRHEGVHDNEDTRGWRAQGAFASHHRQHPPHGLLAAPQRVPAAALQRGAYWSFLLFSGMCFACLFCGRGGGQDRSYLLCRVFFAHESRNMQYGYRGSRRSVQKRLRLTFCIQKISSTPPQWSWDPTHSVETAPLSLTVLSLFPSLQKKRQQTSGCEFCVLDALLLVVSTFFRCSCVAAAVAAGGSYSNYFSTPGSPSPPSLITFSQLLAAVTSPVVSPSPIRWYGSVSAKRIHTHKQVEAKYPEQIKVFYSHSCDSIEQLPEGGGIEVRASLHGSDDGNKEEGEQKVFRPRLLVGADGLKSTVGRPVADGGGDISRLGGTWKLDAAALVRLLGASISRASVARLHMNLSSMWCISWFPCSWYREIVGTACPVAYLPESCFFVPPFFISITTVRLST